jgi:hypothetical protein
LAALLFICFVQNCGHNQAEFTASARSAVNFAGPDYRKKGPVRFDKTEGSLISHTGCEVIYSRFRPQNTAADFRVVLGHGFLRSKQRMEYLAQHLAGWGIEVVSVEFCNSKLWAGHHDRNGADMVAVSQDLRTAKAIYMGFSAGGLAALAASNLDVDTQAFFGLDMVDNLSLGKQIALQIKIPLYGLIADPSACNADNNGLGVYAIASRAFILKVEDATHCHFEFPLDAKCTIVCGRGEKRYSRQEIQQTILGLTTAFVLWQTGIDPSAASWWSVDSGNHKSLIKAGYIARIN